MSFPSMRYTDGTPRSKKKANMSWPSPWRLKRTKRNKLEGRTDILGSLSKDVFERRTSTGSEAFSLFIRLDTTKFVLLSFFSPIKTIYLRVSTKPQPNAAKSPLPVDVRRSKTLLLKLPTLEFARTRQDQSCLHDSNLRCCTRYSSLFCSRWWGMNFLKIQESVYGFGGMKCSCNCSAIN